MIRRIIFEDEGRRKLADGIRRLCGLLSCEGGILVNGSGTLSAQTAAKEMEDEDLYCNQGIRLAAEAISEINARTGCGTKEAARMALVQLAACERAAASGINPVYLSQEMRKYAEQIAEKAQAAAVHEQIDMRAGLNRITRDEELTDLVLQGIEQGEVIVKDSVQAETTLEIVNGMTLNSRLMVGKAASLKDVKILVTDQKISRFSQILPLLEKMAGRPLFIAADDIEGEALTLLKANVEKRRIKVWAVKAPGIGRRKADMLADLAALTSTEVYGEYDPVSWDKLVPEMLGTAPAVEVSAESAVVQRSAEAFTAARIAEIREKLAGPGVNFYDQQVLRERIACLSGHVPVIRVGGATVTELKEEKLKLEYAVAYAQSVKKYGMLPKGYEKQFQAETPAEKIILLSIEKELKDREVSAELFVLLLKKITSLTAMWLTTGAVMVSTGYDREDRELIKSGVDVERLRG